MSSIDTNIDHYTTIDLLQLLNLDNDEVSEDDIIDATDRLITKYQKINPAISEFFNDVQERLIDELEKIPVTSETETYDGINNNNNNNNRRAQPPALETDDNGFRVGVTPDIMGLRTDPDAGLARSDQQLAWERKQYLDDPAAAQKYTSRENKVQISRDENEHYQMKRERLGVVNAYNVPISQGTTNPTLRNTISRIINVDSQFRQAIFPYSNDPTSATSSSSFTIMLTEPLVNVTSIKLYSINIPYTWYPLDESTGNNVMYVDLGTGIDGKQTITIASGIYKPLTLIAAIKAQIVANLYLNNKIDISYNETTGKCTIYNHTLNVIRVTFYDAASDEPPGGCKKTAKLNNNLGWVLGFRSNNVSGVESTNSFTLYGMVYDVPALTLLTASNTGQEEPGTLTSEAIVDPYGPKYFILTIDDFNNNRVISGMVNVGSVDTQLSVPSYYNEDIPYICQPNIKATLSVPTYVPSVPRRLTQAQLYSINQIMASRRNNTKDRELGPTTSDVFAVIPLRTQTLSIGQAFTDYGPTLMLNERTYFGPVVINKLRVTLKDDKGYVVNLHGNDWSFTLVTQELYEY
jgi:hypothetical protein